LGGVSRSPVLEAGMVVSSLAPDPRRPGYLVVEVDRARYATLPLEVVHRLGLAVGEALEGEQVAGLQRAAEVESAFLVASRLVAMRPRSVHDLLAKLRERGHRPPAVTEAVGRLEAAGLLDDAAYARHFVRVRASRGHGPGRLLHDLLSRGVDRVVAERAIAEVLAAEDVNQAVQARSLAERRLAQLAGVPAPQRRRRVLAYLARRGYRGREVQEMVSRLLAGDGASLGAG
jgi:regulatory protein